MIAIVIKESMGPYTQAVGLISLYKAYSQFGPGKHAEVLSYGRSALNDSAACPCDYSLLHAAYRLAAFRPLINTPKSNIGFLV